MDGNPGRLGSFFLIIGIIVLIVFYGSQQGPDPLFELLLAGILLSALGFMISWRGRRRRSTAERFRMVRKFKRTSLNEPVSSKEEGKRKKEKS
jgi:hypothetical protein